MGRRADVRYRFNGSCTLFQYMYLRLRRTCGTGHFASCSRHDPDISVTGKLPRSRADLWQRVSTSHQARAHFVCRLWSRLGRRGEACDDYRKDVDLANSGVWTIRSLACLHPCAQRAPAPYPSASPVIHEREACQAWDDPTCARQP